MSRLRSAVVLSVLAQHSNLLISFVGITVVARLLTPAEIGTFAVASSLAVLAIEIRTFGISQYLVREKELDEEKLRTAFGAMLLVSWSLAAAIVAGAPFVASFYDQPALRQVLWILSGTFVLAPLSTVPFAMMLRDMRFDRVLRVKTTSALVRTGGSIGFVLLGWSYHGLAAGVLAGAVAELLAISWFDRSRSLIRPGLSRWRSVFAFGTVTSAAGALQRFTQGIPDLVLGRLASMSDVGMFSRGLGLVSFVGKLIEAAVQPAILPHLSEIRRRKGDVGREYLRCISLHAAVTLPAFAVVGILAGPLIDLFFGDQWTAAVPIATVLTLWAMLRTVHAFLPNALLAQDRERVVLGIETCSFVSRLALVVALVPYGLLAAAWGVCLSGVVTLAVCTLAADRCLKVGPLEIARALAPSVTLAAVCGAVAWALTAFTGLGANGSLVQLAVAGPVLLVTWLATLRLLRHDLWPIVHDLTLTATGAFRTRPIEP